MPRKKISEMSWFQRRRNSLAGKTFLTITLFSLIISAAGISFGHYLYYSSVRRDYRNRAWQMSRTANQFMDKDEALEEAGQVMTTYFLELTEEERDQLQDKKSPLLSRFDRDLPHEDVCRYLEKANEEIAAMVKEATQDTLSKVLYETSCKMKNSFSRSDA